MSDRPGDAPVGRAIAVMAQAAWSAGKWLTVVTVVQELIVAVAYVVAVYGGKLVVDGAVAHDSTRAAIGGLIVATAMAARQMCSWADSISDLRERTAMRLEQQMVDLSAGLAGIEHHERPDLLDQLELVREHRFSLGDVVYAASGALSNGVALTASVVLLARLDPVLPLVVLGGFVSLVQAAPLERIASARREESAADHRLTLQLEDLSRAPQAAAELRLHRVQELVLRRHHEAGSRAIAVEQPAQLKATALSLIGGAFFAGSQLAAIAFTVRLGARGNLSAGDVVLGIGLIRRSAGQLGALINGVVGHFLRQLRSVRRLVWLMNEAEIERRRLGATEPAAVPTKLVDGIRFEDVSFAYPASTVPALSRVNIHLRAGTTVAFVGENGAGKSTLVKLLLRLYEPSSGRIRVEGIDLTRLDIADWRRRASGAFQEPARPELPVQEVVGLGEVAHVDDEVRVLAAVEAAGAGAVVAALPAKLATPVGPSFDDGVQLSGGQWQLLALARALMRQRSLLVVLDEPTAALDPAREHALFERYAQAARIAADETGGITVLVSHRFSTVRMADHIIVIDDGGVREDGTHDELMAMAGLYAELYSMQAHAYRR